MDSGAFRRARRFVVYHLEREIALQAWGDRGGFLQTRNKDLQLARALDFLRGADSPQGLLQSVPASEPVAAGDGNPDPGL